MFAAEPRRARCWPSCGRALPVVPAVSCVAEALPFSDATFAGVTVAQAFHWFDAPAALAESHAGPSSWRGPGHGVQRARRVGGVGRGADRSDRGTQWWPSLRRPGGAVLARGGCRLRVVRVAGGEALRQSGDVLACSRSWSGCGPRPSWPSWRPRPASGSMGEVDRHDRADTWVGGRSELHLSAPHGAVHVAPGLP